MYQSRSGTWRPRFAQLTLGDKAPYFYCRGDGQLEDSFEMLRIVHGIDQATFAAAPHCYSICNTNSPLQLDVPMTEGIIKFAMHGQLVIVTPVHARRRDGARDHCRAP